MVSDDAAPLNLQDVRFSTIRGAVRLSARLKNDARRSHAKAKQQLAGSKAEPVYVGIEATGRVAQAAEHVAEIIGKPVPTTPNDAVITLKAMLGVNI